MRPATAALRRIISGTGEWVLGQQSRLNQQELKELSDELTALSEKQYEARQTEVFIPMTAEEIEAFDLRNARISEIYTIFGRHDAKR